MIRPARVIGIAALLAVQALAVLVMASACTASDASPPRLRPGAPAAGSGLGSPVPLGSVPASPSTIGTRPALPDAPPTRVRIKKIHVDSPLVNLRLDATGALETPKDYAIAGWYSEGTRPGDVGPAVIAGHVDNKRGPAVFYRLRDLRPGDTIEVSRGGQWLVFRVVKTSWHPKTDFPTEQVYGPTPDPQLRLVTCGGTFDHSLGSYPENLVVFAVAA